MEVLCAVGVFQLRQAMRQQLSLRELGKHARQFLLDELKAGDGTAELNPMRRVLSYFVIACHGGPDCTPGDAVARVVETR